MRTVNYRGGVICFEVPNDWIEGEDPDGGASFYADEPDSPTLFVNVLTLEVPDLHATAEAEVLTSRSKEAGQTIVTFENGNPALVYSERIEQDGEAGVLHRWEIARAVPPRNMRLAIFSLAVKDSQCAVADSKGIFQTVDRIARGRTFASEIGNVGASRG